MPSKQSPDEEIELITAGIKARAAERQRAIQTGNVHAEWQADQAITQGLYNAANACPSSAPKASYNFRSAADQFSRTTSRQQRDNIIFRIAKGILVHKVAAAILLGAGGLAVATLATPVIATAADGSAIDGQMIDNGDGTSQFLYGDNGFGMANTQQLFDNSTGQAIGQPDPVGLGDTFVNVVHGISNWLSF